MYLTISPQKLSHNFSQSVRDFVSYLEKENEGKTPEEKELFFNQHNNDIHPSVVTQEIDANAGKLKKTEPKYYSITINPSKYELAPIGNNQESLKRYTREIMKGYATAFNREFNGRPISVEDIKYFAKVEYQRFFKGTDREIKENSPFIKRIAAWKTRSEKSYREKLMEMYWKVVKKRDQQCLKEDQKMVFSSPEEDQNLIYPCPEEDQKMVHWCPEEDQNMVYPCPEEDQKMIHRCPEEDQKMLHRCPEEDQKMAHRCPEEDQNLVSNINTYKHINIKKKNKPESEKEVIEFFKSKKWRVVEGHKNFHHYQTIGWKRRGATPLTVWWAAAESWVLRGMELKA